MSNQKFAYQVQIDQRCVDEYHSDERYGEWRESYSNSFEYIKPLPADRSYPDVVSTHDLKEGDKAYLVWFEYSTGDSFGQGKNARVEAVGLFRDKGIAKELARSIETFNGTDSLDVLNFEYSKSNKFTCETSDGQTFEYAYAPWTGYFETLETVHVEEVTIS